MALRVERNCEPIPGYKLLERLGSGGFGEVWKAEAPGGIHKAIKFVFGNLECTDGGGKPAEQELKALSRVKTVRHPFILSLERYDVIDGQLVIVMELADKNLWDRFKECRAQGLPGLPRDELLRYLDEAAEALDLMNQEYQLQHLDIKPQNLFLVRNHVKVADFGLVKDFEGLRAAVTGGVTPVYAAPETFDGWASRFSDQYSLAIVFQELLTGQRPIAGSTSRQLILQHLQGTPNLSVLPPADQPVIGRALAKEPDTRFPSCGELVQALKAAGGTVPRSAPAAPTAAGSATPAPSAFLLPEHGRGLDRGGLTYSTPLPWAAAAAPAPRPESPDPGKTVVRSAPPIDFRQGPPTEVEGDGILVPALVLGLGRMGRLVLQRFRVMLLTRFGSLDAVPHLRLLAVDSDPDEEGLAELTNVAGPPGQETLLARLNRPGHYLKPRDGHAPLESWFNPKLIFRIPRTQVTTGLRALGRLAFLDHYRAITQRLRAELDACADPDVLAKAGRQTGLGLRRHQPRVYVVTSLGGGTGGGTFLDAAYVVRDQLRRMGYERPDVVGVLLLPAPDGRTPRATLALSNAYAALTELNHFHAPDVTFVAQYSSKEPPVRDSGPPFGRTVAVPTLQEGDRESAREVADLAGGLLYHELLTPLGPAADAGRAARPAPAGVAGVATFGLFRLTWPRAVLLQQAARRVGRRLTAHWVAKDAGPVRANVAAWLAGQWEELGLAPGRLLAHLQDACREALGLDPEEAFAAVIQRQAEGSAAAPSPEPASGVRALAELDTLLRPPADNVPPDPANPTTLVQVLEAATRRLTAERKQAMHAGIQDLAEAPAFRLAGAEEALRQLDAAAAQHAAAQETLELELSAKAAELRARCVALLGARQSLSGWWKRKDKMAGGLVETLALYAKTYFQVRLLRSLLAAYKALRDGVPDHLRELALDRAKLTELQQAHDGVTAAGAAAAGPGPARAVLPPGWRTVREAAAALDAAVGHEELLALDRKVQALLVRQYQSLHQLCLTASHRFREMAAAVHEVVEGHLEARLGPSNAARVYLEQRPGEEVARDELLAVFDEAIPELGGPNPRPEDEVRILLAPADEAGQRLLNLARRAVPGVTAAAAALDDLVFYREKPFLPLAALPQLGPQGHAAYEQIAALEHSLPHSRTDITDWVPATRG